MTHVLLAFVVGLLLLLAAWRYTRWARSPRSAEPSAGLNFTNFIHLGLENLFRFIAEITGSDEDARRYFPLGGTIFLYIFFSDLLGIIPGFEPPTSHMQMNLAIAICVFLATHYFGIRMQGWRYIRQFTGNTWYLAPLMLPLELVSHIVRPLSLTVRLLGNMFADHKVLAIFTFLFPLAIPIPFLFLGVLVSFIQALVFMTLSIIYFSMATSHDH